VGEAGGRYYFIMEYVPGETLWDHIRRTGPLPERRALEIARQVARGLKHAQSHGFIHRDIKPKNILLTPEGVAKICDFGLARTLKEEDVAKEEGFLHVTPSYASPEQCRAAPHVDHRSDIYSLGVSLFEMLTGKRPFGGATSKDIMKAQATAPPPAPETFNPAVSAPVSELVLRMLAKKPDDRFKSYDVLLGVLDTALQSGGEAPSPDAPDPPVAAAEIRRRKLLLAGGAGAAVVLVLLVLLLRSGGPAKPPPPPPDTSHLQAYQEAKTHQARAAGIPGDLAAARSRWAELEARYRGTPHHPLFSAGLRDSEAKFSAEADRVAGALLGDADAAVKEGRHLEGLRLLRSFPEPFARSDAGLLVGKRALEVERALDEHVRAETQACLDHSAAKRFDAARQRLHSLRLALVARLPDGSEDVLPVYKTRIEDVQKRIADEQAAAKTPKPEEPAVAKKPPPPANPVPDPGTAAKPPPDPAKTADPAGRPPRPRRAGAVPPDVLAALRDPAVRADRERRPQLAAFFKTLGGRSLVHRAMALFLSRPERDWALSGVPGEAFETYLASPDLDAAESLTPAQHAALLVELAQSIAASGRSTADALQLFAVAHACEIAAAKAVVDPVVAQQARLARGPLTGIWGPAPAVVRVELAGTLRKGQSASKAADAALAATDFPTRYLGGLLLLKEITLEAATAEAAWKKLGASAPDPGWSKVCDGVAERIQLSATCEACAGQGRYPCGACGGVGATACPGCRGLGKVPDGAGGHNTCAPCRGKKIVDCAVCQRAKVLKCAVCDSKKTRAALPGSLWRYVEDLALCATCEGAGAQLADTGWPCPACEGWGRRLGDVPGAFERLPAWTKGREGRAAWMALRWLARHQAPEGFWAQNAWTAACRGPGCRAEPTIGDHDVGLTALALQGFLGAGWSGDTDLAVGGIPAGQVVRRGLVWLLQQQQADGRLAAGQSQKPTLDHLLATWTLCTSLQAFPVAGAAGDQERAAIREAASKAVRWAVLNQNRGGGWGYAPGSPSTTWVSAWGAQALGAARELGLDVAKPSLIQLLQWFDQNTDRTDYLLGYQPQFRGTVNLPASPQFLHHETLSLVGGLGRMGIETRSNATVASAEKIIVRDMPNADPLRRDYAYWSLGTMFLAVRDQRKGAAWTAWSQALHREVLSVQETADTCALGSIPPTDRWSAGGGRVYATAMIAFGLEYAAGVRPLAWPSKK
ncbi:MAG TPA: protein kinase, partial [Planctomycetota bacterium]|nr:protein kinase [Planctomycetota bacterium]